MTTEIFFSSKRLGDITYEQLQRMLNRFELGTLISGVRTARGSGNQTLLVTASSGAYILKGNPLYEGQLAEEKYVVDQLHARTRLPVPYPFLVDEADEVFGWGYALMPRLPGWHMHDPKLQAEVGFADRLELAKLLALRLSEMHGWQGECFGEWDPVNGRMRPFEGTYSSWLFNRILFWLDDARKYSVITEADVEWVKHLLNASRKCLDELKASCFVMGDFKADNLLVERGKKGWQLSGIFDFTSVYFGDGLADLPKMVISYMEEGQAELARQFMKTYLKHANESSLESVAARFRVHMLHQRVLDWGCAHAIQRVTWDPRLSFAEWAKPYVEAAEGIILA